jgi:pyridoxal 5'-phosphate synthase pdxS subunit
VQASDPADGTGSSHVKRGIAEMLKGGVIMDVADVEQARIAEDAGAVAVVAFDHVPTNILDHSRTAGISELEMINQIITAVSIPVIGRCRPGRFVDAQVMQSLGVDYIDESDVGSPEDHNHHIDKWNFTVPFVCGASNLTEALHHINQGAAIIRSITKAGTGNGSNASDNIRRIRAEMATLSSLPDNELYCAARQLQVPHGLVKEVARTGDLPVALFAAGGVATPADAAAMMQLGADGLFVGSDVFKCRNPGERAAALANAVTFFDEPAVIAKISRDVGITAW